MPHLEHLGTLNFGVVSTRQVLQTGLTDYQVKLLVARGAVARIRRGWLRLPGAHKLAVRAVAAGGVLSAASALSLRGVWTPPGPLYVRASRSDQVKTGPDIVPVTLPGVPTIPSVDPLETSLLAALLHCPIETAVVVVDSIRRQGLLHSEDVHSLASRAGSRGQRILNLSIARSDSGTETIFRLWLFSKRIKFEVQVQIHGVGRVDFLIGNCLVIEIDSRAHHTEFANYAEDRRRDRRLVGLGYRVVRLTYQDVMYQLDVVGAEIIDILRRGEHRRVPHSQR